MGKRKELDKFQGSDDRRVLPAVDEPGLAAGGDSAVHIVWLKSVM